MKSVYVSRKDILEKKDCICKLENFMPINTYFDGVIGDTNYQCNLCGKIISDREYKDRAREGLQVIL